LSGWCPERSRRAPENLASGHDFLTALTCPQLRHRMAASVGFPP
jgi:hypothetical protein